MEFEIESFNLFNISRFCMIVRLCLAAMRFVGCISVGVLAVSVCVSVNFALTSVQCKI